MTDHVIPERRSFIMSRVGQKNTTPEMMLRRALHARGFRFRLHRRDLPGSPDLVFPSRRKMILVHDCFWHGHGCRGGKAPGSRTAYRLPKIAANKIRDDLTKRAPRKMSRSRRVEQGFGAQSNDMGGMLPRCIGIARAKARIGLKNLACTMRRAVQLDALAAVRASP